MGELIIATFSEPALSHESIVWPLPIRKALALLIYLAVTGQAHPRGRLALLW